MKSGRPWGGERTPKKPAPPADRPPPSGSAVSRAHELFKQGQTREALALLRPLVERKGEVDLDAAALAAACLGSDGKYDEAARIDRIACDAHPENPQGWNSLGYDLLNAGDLEGALEAYTRAIELEPNRASAHYNIARIAARLKDRTLAITHIVRAVELQADFLERLDEDPDLRPFKDDPALNERLPGHADPDDPYADFYKTES